MIIAMIYCYMNAPLSNSKLYIKLLLKQSSGMLFAVAKSIISAKHFFKYKICFAMCDRKITFAYISQA